MSDGCKHLGIVDSLLGSVDSILGIRDSIGAVKQPSYLVTRTWYTDSTKAVQSADVEGYPFDVEVQILPSPNVVEYKQNIRVKEGGTAKNGDIKLKDISRNLYKEKDLDGSSDFKNVEKLYRVGAKIYQVVSTDEDYVTFDVVLKELTNQTRNV